MTDQRARASLFTERRQAFGLLLAAVMGLGMGQTVTFAILPPIGRELGLSEFQVGSIFSVSALIWVLLSPTWGRLSDRHGRKPIILIGMVGYIVSTLAFTFAILFGMHSAASLLLVYILMVLTRSIYGAIGPGVRVASQAYIVDRTSLGDRTVAIASMAAAFGLGNALGPGLAAFSTFGLLTPLWITVVLMIALAIAIAILLPEKSQPDTRKRRARLPVTDQRIRAFLIYGIIASFAVATPMQASAFYFIDVLGFEPKQAAQFVGVGLASSAMAALFSQLVLVQRLRLTPATMMMSGAALICVAQFGIAASSNFGSVVFALMINGLGAGLAFPGFSAGASLAVSSDEQGAVAGITGAMGAAGFSLVPFINLTLYELNPRLPFLLDGILVAGLLLFTIRSSAIRNAGHAVETISEEFDENFHH